MKSLNDKHYKAIILDVDGTTIRYEQNALPTEKVTTAIKKAQKKIFVCLASARPYNALEHIVKHLELSDLIVANGGARIINAKNNATVWEQPLDRNDAIKVGEILQEMGLPCFVNDDGLDTIFSENYIPKKPLEMVSQKLEKETADEAIKKLSHISGITLHTTFSWEKGKTDILINHAAATKQTGVLEVAKILNINTHEIIGVGDSGNDFPLLMACGLKVAMGNATAGLKEIADYIAPDVNDDGAADVIEKYVL